MRFLIKLQKIDRRFIYLLVAAVIILPLVVRPSQQHPNAVAEVQSAYDTLDRIPKDR